MEYIVVFVTAGSMEEGRTIARTLVEEGLAACVNIIDGVRSIYRWKGEICDDEEVFLVIKSRRALFGRLEKRVRELHSYEVPEVIAIPLSAGAEAYLSWMDEVLQ